MDDSTPAGNNKVHGATSGRSFSPGPQAKLQGQKRLLFDSTPGNRLYCPPTELGTQHWQHTVSLTLLKPAHKAARLQIPF